jgi:hypothetical protein
VQSLWIEAVATDPDRPWGEQDTWLQRIQVDGRDLAAGESITWDAVTYVAGAVLVRQPNGCLERPIPNRGK